MSKKIRFIYLREGDKGTCSPFGVVAVLLNSNDRTVSYGVSTVHSGSNDRFDASLAKDIAVGRLVNNSNTIMLFSGEESCHEITRIVFEQILREDKRKHNLAGRAKKSITRWLNKARENANKPPLSVVSKFEKFMKEIEGEARREGGQAVRELETFRTYFKEARHQLSFAS